MINTGVNEGSAKIYQFPAGGVHFLMRHRSAAALRAGWQKDAFSPA